MRLMMSVIIPTTDATNQAAEDGTMGAAIQKIIDDVDPEAAYFSMLHGERYFFLVFEEEDGAKLMQHNEFLMQKLSARVQHAPMLSKEDLARGFQ